MPHTTPTQAAAVLTESEIEAVVYSLCPDFDDAHEGPSMDSMVDLVRWAEQEILKKLGAQEPVAWLLEGVGVNDSGSRSVHLRMPLNVDARYWRVVPVYAVPTPALLGASVGEPSVPANVIEAVSAYGDSRADADGKSAEKLGAVVRAMRADLATRASSSAQAVEDATDAARYRWLREQVWNEAPMCVIMRPKANARLGSDCPALGRLDDAIDAARAGGAA